MENPSHGNQCSPKKKTLNPFVPPGHRRSCNFASIGQCRHRFGVFSKPNSSLIQKSVQDNPIQPKKKPDLKSISLNRLLIWLRSRSCPPQFLEFKNKGKEKVAKKKKKPPNEKVCAAAESKEVVSRKGQVSKGIGGDAWLILHLSERNRPNKVAPLGSLRWLSLRFPLLQEIKFRGKNDDGGRRGGVHCKVSEVLVGVSAVWKEKEEIVKWRSKIRVFGSCEVFVVGLIKADWSFPVLHENLWRPDSDEEERVFDVLNQSLSLSFRFSARKGKQEELSTWGRRVKGYGRFGVWKGVQSGDCRALSVLFERSQDQRKLC